MGIVASVVPTDYLSSCECQKVGNESRSFWYLTFSGDGHISGTSSNAPTIADASAEGGSGSDAGPEADGGSRIPEDCKTACQKMIGICSDPTMALLSCTWLRRNDDGAIVKCEWETHKYCMPDGIC
jgi:hypothetical protein